MRRKVASGCSGNGRRQGEKFFSAAKRHSQKDENFKKSPINNKL